MRLPPASRLLKKNTKRDKKRRRKGLWWLFNAYSRRNEWIESQGVRESEEEIGSPDFNRLYSKMAHYSTPDWSDEADFWAMARKAKQRSEDEKFEQELNDYYNDQTD